jgi:hypothetical protein
VVAQPMRKQEILVSPHQPVFLNNKNPQGALRTVFRYDLICISYPPPTAIPLTHKTLYLQKKKGEVATFTHFRK